MARGSNAQHRYFVKDGRVFRITEAQETRIVRAIRGGTKVEDAISGNCLDLMPVDTKPEPLADTVAYFQGFAVPVESRKGKTA